MRRFVKLVPLFIALVLIFGVTLAPGGVAVAQAPPGTVVYNLYATDGYVEMADMLPVYIYGFIGGREGVPFEFTSTYCIGDGIGRTCGYPWAEPALDPVPGFNVGVPGGAMAPQGGTWAGQDALFAGNAQFPAPIIYATVGDVVEIRLKNLGVTAQPTAPNDPHSIHLHGLDVDAANDGVPETSLGAVPANLCSDGSTDPTGLCAGIGPAPGAGNVIVYMFSPTHAGTYMYHCHQEADIHVNMGMFGALVVYNPGDPAAATGPGAGMGGNLYGVPYDRDYILLLGEFDIRGHADEELTYGGLVPANSWDPWPFNWALYEPQYWFINGISFPNTIHADFPSTYTFAEWLAAHPGYDPLITGSVGAPSAGWGTPGQKALIRVINMGFETQPMHMHGYHGKVIGSDQRAWDWATAPKSKTNKAGVRPFGEGLEKNTLTIGSGETYDWLIDFGQQSFNSVYPPNSVPPSPFGSATESRYNAFDPVANGLCVPGLPENAPLPNYYDGVTIDPITNMPYPLCPPIPVDGDLAAPGPYIAGPVVTGLFEGLTPGAVSQFFPFHNHDDYKATNDGVYPGGMFTMIVPTP
jgi:FtsP/CotA-like multicopper oxidase with cupredoxin domain